MPGDAWHRPDVGIIGQFWRQNGRQGYNLIGHEEKRLSGDSKLSEAEKLRLKTDTTNSPQAETPEPSPITIDDNLVGTIVANRYKILGLLGSGGMGTVYQATHLHMNKTLALKVLHPDQASTENSRLRFQQECEASAKLVHQNLVPVHDYGYLDSGQPYIVMDYVCGQPLSDLIKQGPLPQDRALNIFCQITDALGAAHRMGVIHRDLKPSNVMIELDDFVKVVDFGIAKITGPGRAQNLTSTGEIFGSPLYMSPEQCRGAVSVDARSDIYSMGCVMYETLTGVPPHSGANALETIYKHVNEKPTPFAAVNPRNAVDSRLEEVVLQALNKQPGDRYHSAQQLKSALLGQPGAPGQSSPTSAFEALRFMPSTASLKKLSIALLIMLCTFVVGRTLLTLRMTNHDQPQHQSAQITSADEANRAAEMQWNQGDHQGSIRMLKQFMDEYEKTYGTRHAVPYARAELDYARHMRDDGDFRGADPYAKEAADTLDNLTGPDSELTDWALFHYACCKSLERDLPAADSLFKRVLAIRGRVGGGRNSFEYAEALRFYARVFETRGEIAKARQMASEALSIEKRTRPDCHSVVELQDYLQKLNQYGR